MYFDTSASAPLSDKALDAFITCSQALSANHQSKHSFGEIAQNQINADIKSFKEVLNLDKHHLTFTQNATQANKLVIDHVLSKHKDPHIITGPFEHSSIVRALGHNQKQGVRIDVLKTNKEGLFDLNSLKDLIKDNTALIIVNPVDSELGIIQDVTRIKNISGDIPVLLDATQAIGKIKLDLNIFDYITFSAHKFYGPKGLGGVLSLDKISYHSGTLSPALIHSSIIALEETMNQDVKIVQSYKESILDALKDIDNIYINNRTHSIPHIINLSIITNKELDLVKEFSDRGIYLSKGSACTRGAYSPNIYRLTQDKARALSSIRISLSHLNTQNEVETLIQTIKEVSKL